MIRPLDANHGSIIRRLFSIKDIALEQLSTRVRYVCKLFSLKKQKEKSAYKKAEIHKISDSAHVNIVEKDLCIAQESRRP